MEDKNRYSVRAPSRGGAREGAGRPKGSGNKIKIEDLLTDIETATNMPYTQRIALNYVEAIDRQDWTRVENYDKAFLNKIVADKQSVEVVESEDTIEAKKIAFAEALAKLTGSKEDTK